MEIVTRSFKWLLICKHCVDWSQISLDMPRGRENESLFERSRINICSDGRKTNLHRFRKIFFFVTDYVKNVQADLMTLAQFRFEQAVTIGDPYGFWNVSSL